MPDTPSVEKIIFQSELFRQRAADFGLEPVNGITENPDMAELSEALVAVIKDDLLLREGYRLSGLFAGKQKLMACYEHFADTGKVDMTCAFNFYAEDVRRLNELAQTITKSSGPSISVP